MKEKLSKSDCTALLQTKAAELQRLPKKSDFQENEVMAIKSYFGPWPRALEAAGLKPPRLVDNKEKNRARRERAKARRIESKK